MKSNRGIILADHSNFSATGGAEKNGLRLSKELQNQTDKKIVVVGTKIQLFWHIVLHVIRVERIGTFLSYKASAHMSLMLRLFGVRTMSRVNNSPEAYLYWRGFKSIVSFFARLNPHKCDVQIYNSKKVMEFYNLNSPKKIKRIYLPNFYEPVGEFKLKPQKYFIMAARHSPEKRLSETYDMITNYKFVKHGDVKLYTNKEIHSLNARPFSELSIHFNDIYISMSWFEGMPNMVFEALSHGAGLILSNCWAHAELANDLENSGLAARVMMLDIDNSADCEKRIQEFRLTLDRHDLEEIQNLTQRYFSNMAQHRKEVLVEIGNIL